MRNQKDALLVLDNKSDKDHEKKEESNLSPGFEDQGTSFDIKTISQDYEKNKGWREFGKWVFSIATLGFGAL